MHIFISYAKVDTYDFAIRLQDELRQLPDVTVWMDETLIPGESWAVQIQSEIRRCDVVVVLLSPDVNREPDGEKGHSFVINEIEFAQRRHKPVIPVMAQATDMPIQIATLQYIDFTHNQTIGLKRLTQEIARRVRIVDTLPPTPATPVTIPRIPSAYRRIILIVGIIGLAVIVLAIVIPPIVNISKGTPTANVAVLPTDVASQSLAAPIPTLTPLPLTATSMSTTVPPTRTPMDIPPTNISTSLPLGYTPIFHNSDWTSKYQTFDSIEMVLVPVGCFMMGSDDGDADEKPVTKQCIQKPFWIDKTEVTNQQYGSTGRIKGDNHPRDSVTWFKARDFCKSRNERLPTELEWEYAARGPDSFVYPWGNDFVPDNLVYYVNSGTSSLDVGSRPNGHSWVGAFDLMGNVWEWTSSLYGKSWHTSPSSGLIIFDSIFSYPYMSNDGREVTASSDFNTIHVRRGGSWYGVIGVVRASTRDGAWSSYDLSDMGVRCVHDFNPSNFLG
jgi:formylglycine-generating enzyme required for sulfatase activity